MGKVFCLRWFHPSPLRFDSKAPLKLQVFLESDIEAVAMRMKDLFITHGKGKLLLVDGHGRGWMEENPFGIRTDWEQRVIERGAPMYRIMLRKVP